MRKLLLFAVVLIVASIAHLRWTISNMHRFCDETQAGEAVADFRARAKEARYPLHDSPETKELTAFDTWLLMTLRCEASYELDRITATKVWSTD